MAAAALGNGYLCTDEPVCCDESVRRDYGGWSATRRCSTEGLPPVAWLFATPFLNETVAFGRVSWCDADEDYGGCPARPRSFERTLCQSCLLCSPGLSFTSAIGSVKSLLPVALGNLIAESGAAWLCMSDGLPQPWLSRWKLAFEGIWRGLKLRRAS